MPSGSSTGRRRTVTCPFEGNLKACGPADAEARSASASRRTVAASRERPRRHLRPGRLHGVHPGLPASSAGAGNGTRSGGALHVARCSTCSACSASRSSGWRFGGPRLAATLAFAWAAYPFTQYASSSNTNDAILPGAVDLRVLLFASPPARGGFAALAGWTKFAALSSRRCGRRTRSATAGASCASSAGFAARDARRVLDPAARAEPARTRHASSGTARSAGSSAASRRSRSGTGGSTTRGASRTSTSLQQFAAGAARRGRARGRVRPAAQVAVAARRADRRAADRRSSSC